jgi:peptidoglycan hydrolase-like protein with peptidoglycan-binding domain
LLLFAAILAGCTATPDNTVNNQNGAGNLDNVPFPVRGTATPDIAALPSSTIGVIVNLPSGSPSLINQPTNPGVWGSIITSSQPFLTPTPTVWGGIVINTNTPGLATPSPTVMVLKLGASGPTVRSLQQRLKDLGYNIGSVDGDFGTATEAAVKAFQARNNLTADGIAGTATLNKLNSSSALPPRPTATPTPRPTATPFVSQNTYLKLGASGSEVRKMQERLISLGYLLGTANGMFDQITEAAVYAFQNRNTSYSDGIAGPMTLQKLYSSSARSTSSPVGIIGTSIQRGLMDSEIVRRIQSRLKDLRFYTGAIDGDFGASTEAAVKAFQGANRLNPDGRVGPNTYELLFSSSAVGPSGTATATPRPGEQTGIPTRIPFYTNVTPHPNGEYVTLREGDSGTLVRQLQQALKDQNYYSGTVDGLFGFGTTEAVKAFQRAKGLTPDGLAGQGTLRILYQGNYPAGS